MNELENITVQTHDATELAVALDSTRRALLVITDLREVLE